MRKRILIALTALAWPITSSIAVAQDGFTRITTEKEFRRLVVGKKLWIEGNHFTVRKNGGLTGNFGGKRIKGAWAWKDGYWCRNLTAPAQNNDCQRWSVKGKQFYVTRAKGKGKSFVYTVK